MLTDMKILRFHWTKRNDTTPLAPMTLPYVDLTCLFSGEMLYEYNGERIRLKAGDAILFPVGSTRRRLETKTPVQYASFNVLPSEELSFSRCGHMPDCVTPTVPLLLDLFLSDWNANGPQSPRQQNRLFSYLYTHLTEGPANLQNPYVRAIQKYIHQNLASPLPLAAIADEVHLAPEYCCALFKKHTGKTVATYIAEQRIDAARRLFSLGEASVREVAARVGFTDAAYFSKVFRKYTGVTPKEYSQRFGGAV